MQRSSRRDRSREPEDEHSSDTATNTRRRSHRSRETRSSAADSTSDGTETDASQLEDAPQRRQRRRSRGRKAAEETRKTRGINDEERQSSHSEDEEGEEDDTDGRKRSLSNLSTTSSTSATTLALEQLTEEQRRARLEQLMEELEQKKRMVEDGTLAEFCRRVAAFKEERNRLLQMAELHKNLQLKNGKDLYAFEVQRAHHLWQNGKDVLKADLIGKADTVMVKLQTEMKALLEPTAKVAKEGTKPEQVKSTSDKTIKPSMIVAAVKEDTEESKKATEAEVEEGEVAEPLATAKGTPVVKRRKMNEATEVLELSDLLPEEAVRLPFDDITADIAAIVGDRKQTTKASIERLPNGGNVPFKLERRKLHCGKYVFEDGDEVVIESPLVHENYTGTISSITDDAIYIKLPSDQKVRIFLPHLERRRCEIKPLLRGSIATGSLQSMGWTEYEPF
ncbi:hypothetical protein BBO99_00005238 [Phytophthora kernoviae]|uniref:Uncharacterized protein n=2 Tax=Phytophthora kernoviae TaxID=325452 RepID=A0A3R7GWE5_9STRA|nr:hypothetical protein G195_005765 [Phytophthora kernoviae 00238/432]KAG2526198.1 hypothetical protein JM18_004517 [Phytophthora kernoviae]KAG2526871.1 hypothetical protein JM16_003640 [Phytophthora kernoviae]RLN45807.1 hypothetical protein BBI17_005357 [Phytophthora kernoviae]RLN79475.1 hypothetical protein BBO99_00005238 [Phytophthora kernoviae]